LETSTHFSPIESAILNLWFRHCEYLLFYV